MRFGKSVPSGACIVKRNRPPTRKSIAITVIEKPSGPYHSRNASASEKARKTASGGAANSRSIVIVGWSGGALAVTLSVAIFFLLPHRLNIFEIAVEPVEAAFPEPPVCVEPIGRLFQRRGFEPAGPPLRFAAAADQAGLFEHFQMLRHGWQAHRERGGEVEDRRFAGRKTSQDRPPGRIGQSLEGCAQRVGGHRL